MHLAAARIKRTSTRYKNLMGRKAGGVFVQGVFFKKLPVRGAIDYIAQQFSESDLIQLSKDNSIEIIMTSFKPEFLENIEEIKEPAHVRAEREMEFSEKPVRGRGRPRKDSRPDPITGR